MRLVVTVEDATPPGLAWVDGGGLLDGTWHRGDVCATLGLGDGESGAGSVWLVSGGASATWNAAPTGSQYQPATPYAQPGLCLGAAALGDGIHAGAVGGADASGGQAAPLPFTVRIDATAPTASVVSPAAVAADARPAVALDVGDATSGVASAVASIDGAAVPLALAGGRASGRPAAALAYGAHTLAWSVADAAGNHSDGSARFDVPDSTPPALGAPQPPDGASLAAGDVLSAAVAVSDDGSGLDPSTVALTLDGAPLEHVWQADGVVHGIAGGRLAAGVHHLVLKIADRAGNAAHLSWDVTVAPAGTPPPGSTPAGGGSVAGGTTHAAPAPSAQARKRAAAVRALRAYVGARRPRTVMVHLRAHARLRLVVRVRCGATVRTLRARASARGIAVVRVACAGAATVRLATAPARVLVRIAARRLPLRLAVSPGRRSVPTVARVTGHLAELRGRVVLIEALTATGWRRVGRARADASGRFATSFAIAHAGQFALRARAPAVAGAPSAPFVLTMR